MSSELPQIVLHMGSTLDGKGTGEMEHKVNWTEYFRVGETFNEEAYAIGKNTMIQFTKNFYPDLSKYAGVNKTGFNDFVKKSETGKYIIVFDSKGSLGWPTEEIYKHEFYNQAFPNARILLVLTEQVKDEFLGYLQSIGVAYIIAGKENTDIKLAMKKVKELFGIKTVLLEGGPTLSCSFLKEGIVDVVSIVYYPMIGSKDGNTIFGPSDLSEYEFVKHEELPDKTIWVVLKPKK